MSSFDHLIGQVIKGYELRERIGAGGFGIVYRANQQLVEREVAIKVILPEFASKPDFIRRFDSEAQLVARLEHPHITPLYDYWRDPDGAYLVMRYLRGGSLREKLDTSGAFTAQEVARIIDQIASALDLAHRNEVIHRDIKPANILLDEDGNAYLADFGIAKDLADFQAIDTDTENVVGSLDYISPEQARSEPVSPLSDVYTLGILVYELLTSVHPFGDVPAIQRVVKHLRQPVPKITKLPEDFQASINAVIQKATAKVPQDRYQDILAFAAAFREALGSSKETLAISKDDQLTIREQQILQYMNRGLTQREMAAQLKVTVATVKWHIKQLYNKLGVRSRDKALEKAQELSLVREHVDTSSTDKRGRISAIAIAEPQNPYKGLHAFQSSDARFFFGRETHVDSLLERLSETHIYQRFLAVIGASGSGKSSLIRAGLIPALWHGKLPHSETWFLAEMLPGSDPFESLETALLRIAVQAPDNLQAMLKNDVNGLLDAADAILPPDSSELLLFIDQFEEVFTLLNDEAERQHFLDIIRHAVTTLDSRIRIIITLRADYYDKPLNYTQFGELIRTRVETILPLNAKALERAISSPAEQVGVTFEDGLVSLIVSEMVQQVGALPLLQYALTELFDRRDGNLLRHKTYQEIGGAVGALANRADDIYLNMGDQGQKLTKQMFLRLVTLGEGAEDTRRRATHDEILSLTDDRDLMEDVIDTFANYRLLSLDHDPDTRKPTVEVAHEAILRQWKRLREWLDDSRDDIRQERILARATQEWEDSGQDKSYLLSGNRLESVESWIQESQIELTLGERVFVDSSIAYRNKLQLQEDLRRERELKLQQRARIVLTLLVIVFAVAAVIAMALSGLAINERNRAEENFFRAERIRLASQAQIALNSDEDVVAAALLSLKSLALAYSPEADAALLSSLRNGFPLQRFSGHDAEITSVDVSADEQFLITASNDNSIRLWNTQTGELLQIFEGHEGAVVNAVFSPDTTTIMSASADQTVRIWDRESGIELRQIPHPLPILSMALSPTGQYLATSDSSQRAFLWDVATGYYLGEFAGHRNPVRAIAFSPDEQYLATGSEDHRAFIWDIATKEIIHRFEAHTSCVCGLAFSPRGDLLLTTSYDQTAIVWDIETEEEVSILLGHTGRILDGKFSANGRQVITSSQDSTARLWDVNKGQELRTFAGHAAPVTSIWLSLDDELIITGSADRTAQSWSIEFETEPRVYANTLSSIESTNIVLLSLLPDQRVLLTGSADGDIRYWSVDRGIVLRETETARRSTIHNMAMTPQGNMVVTVSTENTVRLWDNATGAEMGQLIGHDGQVFDVDISSDGRNVITGGSDQTARIWNVFTGETLHVLDAHEKAVRAVAFSPDNQLALTGGDDTHVRLWDVLSGENIAQFEGHQDTVRAVAFSPDNLFVASGSDDFNARLWDIETGETVQTLIGHSDLVTAIAFSPDGRFVLTGSADQTARLWDVETGETIRLFIGHTAAIRSVSFSSDGQQIITGDSRSAFIWHTELQTAIDLACEQLPRDFTDEERDFYDILGDEPTCQTDTADSS